MTLRRGVETKLRERIAWFQEIVAHDPEPDDGAPTTGMALPVLQVDPRAGAPAGGGGSGELLQIAQLKRPVFVDVGALADLRPGEMMTADVDGTEILVLNIDGEPYAFRNICPVDERSPLDGGRLTGTVLVCPWHNCAYDARSGKRADDEVGQKALAVVPIAVSGEGVLRVAANVA
jgi:nitrite reductase/ring-hydroxylating ferredoxin subunit